LSRHYRLCFALIALPAPVFLAAALVRRDLSALFLGCKWPGWQRRGD
jgi:hypothetical protein